MHTNREKCSTTTYYSLILSAFERVLVSLAIESSMARTMSTMATTTLPIATADNYTCTGSTEEELVVFERFNFWSDGVVKPLICVVSERSLTLGRK